MKKFIITTISLFIIQITNLFALPGFEQPIDDFNGQFIYYKDYTFERESYIGLLKYDDTKYEIRYFSPEDKSKSLKKIDIDLLFSIDPSKEHLELTGELITSEISYTQDEIDILNYLHDILYEFSSRRIKMGTILPDNSNYTLNKNLQENGIINSETFEQFGGQVSISYDLLIPFFNIKYIKNGKGKILFECIAIGFITNEENSFFKDFNPNIKETKINNISKIKSKNQKNFNSQLMSFTIDDNWNYDAETLPYLCNMKNDNAMIFAFPLEGNNEYTIDTNLDIIHTIRNHIQSSNNTYFILQDCDYKINNKKSEFKITLLSKTAPQADSLFSQQIIYYKKYEGNIYFFNFIAENQLYKANKKYFDNIINSIKISPVTY